jgi:hypothetical protein
MARCAVGDAQEKEREAALWELAKVLHWKMEHLAPEGANWDEAGEEERVFCYHCASAIVRRIDLIGRYYGWSPARDDYMGGHPEVSKKSDAN